MEKALWRFPVFTAFYQKQLGKEKAKPPDSSTAKFSTAL